MSCENVLLMVKRSAAGNQDLNIVCVLVSLVMVRTRYTLAKTDMA